MNCDPDTEDRKTSERTFKRIKAPSKFFDAWSKFYVNEICIPTYFGTFVGGTDNPQASFEIGHKFQQITKYGIIPYDFQVNSLEDGQKAYLNMFVPSDLARYLTLYINRYPGYVAYWQYIGDHVGTYDLAVTYQATPAEKEVTIKNGILLGEDSTWVGNAGSDDFETIQTWLTNRVKKDINVDNYRQVTIIDTLPGERQDRILDVTLTALNDKTK